MFILRPSWDVNLKGHSFLFHMTAQSTKKKKEKTKQAKSYGSSFGNSTVDAVHARDEDTTWETLEGLALW